MTWKVLFVCVCSPQSPSRPTYLPCVQSEQRTAIRASRPWSSSSSSERASEPERRWGRVTCVHTVGLSSTPAVVKSVTDGPFSEQASSEKLIDKVSPRRHAVKRFLFAVLGLWGACGAYFRTSVCQMKRLRNASGNATSKPYASVGLSPTHIYTFLVSFSFLFFSFFSFFFLNTLIRLTHVMRSGFLTAHLSAVGDVNRMRESEQLQL